MSGKRYLLDTNAVIALLSGNSEVEQLVRGADWLGISIITQLEFLAFAGLSQDDRDLFIEFAERVEIVGLVASNTELLNQAIELRLRYRLKFPDAIVMATAVVFDADVVSADVDLQRVSNVRVHSFSK
jgi:tRNA(fMet)-specific endonuclease VapC